MNGASGQRSGVRGPFRERVFLVAFLAETQSIIGDQLARFALSVLVFERTDSATAAALTYAVSFVPAIVGGLLLGHLGDRFAPRSVMAGADLVRAVAFVCMALPGMPVAAIVALLAVAVLIGPAFTSAEVSLLAGALEEETFRAATAARSVSNQLCQVLGFALGGAVVLFLHPRGALLVNAATFVASALVVVFGLTARDGAGHAHPAQDRDPAPFSGLWREARTRRWMGLLVVIGLFVVPESLAVPFGRQVGASTVQTGLLVATIPLGSALGALAIVRVRPTWRARVSGAMAVACGVPLIASAASTSWQVAALCWLVSGVLGGYQVEVITGIVRAIPVAARSRTLGRLGAWLLGAQGVGFGVGGLLANDLSPGTSIAVAAAAGSALAVIALIGLRSENTERYQVA